ncbi:transcriptional regulator [Actinotalea sp. M2MS4P-6]|uniref:sugar-binding transcriptional regulator n=1 Tax=Actinotalea sp. M2MS4P-6 TaxID=2983762 RepID=UPI0021E4A903|nr:sugar-binding domain-containing protein [Actinotalea sp. M2MS4P-6]MCV2395120.1 transcriptional regulator [Actinotalea sp. M2MS4P-6]
MSEGHETPMSREEHALLVRAARMYYVDDSSKVEIADALGVSRFKVARLLEQARDRGVVTITVHDAGTLVPDLATALAEHLGLRRVVVVESAGSLAEVRDEVGQAAANLLGETLEAGEVLGLAWGRTLTAMSAAMPPLPRVDVVQLTGAIGTDLEESPVEIVRKVALRSGGTARPIFAPLVVDDPRTADALRRQPDVAAALKMFDDVTTAMLAIGSWDPPVSQLLAALPPADAAAMREAGVRAEVATILVSDTGEVLAPQFARRCITIRADQLRRIPRVIAVAAGAEKAHAVVAVARSGLLTELVTDRSLAEAALELPPVTTARTEA